MTVRSGRSREPRSSQSMPDCGDFEGLENAEDSEILLYHIMFIFPVFDD
jgi:hypothetical protein